jgi:membrane-associated phospholipid phosphatase
VFKLGKWVGSAEVEVGTAVGLWAIGRYVFAPAKDEPRANKVSHLGIDLIRAQILSQALVQGIKYSGAPRPADGECCAFPSGHSATAFALASVLERHLGYGLVPALAGATYVATSRLVETGIFLSDVMFGAASAWPVDGQLCRPDMGANSYALQPVPIRGGTMVALVRVD